MLKSIRMINCQSWQDSTIELAADRLNVLQADNNVGKSVLFKMLKITADPKHYSAAERRELIRWNCACAAIMYFFTDGSLGYVKVYPTTVIYGYSEDGSRVTESKVPSKVMLEKIGLLTDDSFVANIIDTEQDLLLVNPKLRANYNLMKLLVFNDDLEKLREKAENIQDRVTKAKSNLKYSLAEIEKSLVDVQYVDLASMERKLELAEVCHSVLFQVLIPLYKKMVVLSEETRDALPFKELLSVADTALCLDSIDIENIGIDYFDENLIVLMQVLENVSSVMCKDTGVTDFDENLVQVMNVLDSLSSIEIPCVEAFDESLLSVLQVLDCIESIKVSDVNRYLEEAATALAEKEQLIEQLKGMGTSIKCPIHGEVIYNGEECVPCDN